MDLVERANRFVDVGNPRDQEQLLIDCLAAERHESILALKLLSRDTYGGDTFNWELKAPAAYCLLAWREDGLKALVENVQEEPTSKNFSLALQLLASVSEGHDPLMIGWSRQDSRLREAVNRAVGEWSDLALTARIRLNEFVLSIEDDNTASHQSGLALMALALKTRGAIRNLSHALALRSVAVGPKVIGDYKNLISAKGNDEPSFQRFFEDHPLLLEPRAFQVWSKPDLHGRYEPDFILRTNDDGYVVVEIETPNKLLVTQQYQLSAHVTHAVSQVLRYQEYLREHTSSASRTFPGFSSPRGLVVVGLEATLDQGQREVLRLENRDRSDLSIVGFDALANTARAVINNLVHGIAGTILDSRLK